MASRTRAQELLSGWMGTSHVVHIRKYPKNVQEPGGRLSGHVARRGGGHRPSLVLDAREEQRKGGPSLRVLLCYPEKIGCKRINLVVFCSLACPFLFNCMTRFNIALSSLDVAGTRRYIIHALCSHALNSCGPFSLNNQNPPPLAHFLILPSWSFPSLHITDLSKRNYEFPSYAAGNAPVTKETPSSRRPQRVRVQNHLAFA